MPGRHGTGGRGQRHDGRIDVRPLARTPSAQLAVHGRRAVRDAVPGAAAQLVPIRVRGGQRGHTFLALAFGLSAGRRRVRVIHRAGAERARRPQGHVRRGRARAHGYRLAARVGHPQVPSPLPRFGQQQTRVHFDQRPRPLQKVRGRFPHSTGSVQCHQSESIRLFIRVQRVPYQTYPQKPGHCTFTCYANGFLKTTEPPLDWN